jgi:hypothetical protein
MPSSGKWHHVALFRTDILEEGIASIIKMERIIEVRAFSHSVAQLLVTANIVPSSLILSTLMMEAVHSSETSVLTRVTSRHIPENGILHSHHHENLKSYMIC